MRRILFILVPLLLLLVGGGIAYFLLGPDEIMSRLGMDSVEEDQPEDFISDDVFIVELDVITAELFSAPGESRLISVSLAVDTFSNLESAEIEKRKPLIEDVVVTFFRGLRPDDFAGSRGLERIRDDVTRRIISSIKPIRVKAIYIRSISFST